MIEQTSVRISQRTVTKVLRGLEGAVITSVEESGRVSGSISAHASPKKTPPVVTTETMELQSAPNECASREKSFSCASHGENRFGSHTQTYLKDESDSLSSEYMQVSFATQELFATAAKK